MEKYFFFLLKHKFLILTTITIITLFSFLQLDNIIIRSSVRDLLSSNASSYKEYNQFMAEFGGNTTIQIGFVDVLYSQALLKTLYATEKKIDQ